jgi:DNA repair protein SbcD/Mre11
VIFMASSTGSRSSFCFVHAADLHLDTPFKGIGKTAAPVAAALREASLEAFDDLVSLCLERRAAFLVVAGDVYDGAERGIRAQLRFRDGLARLSDAGIATFVVHGNHDPIESGWPAVGTWPSGVTVFGAESVEAVPVVRDGQQIAVVHGISYGRREVRENLALRFSRGAGPGLQIGALHCNVGGAAEGHEDYSPCSLDDLHRVGLDYWALGHIHTTLVLSGRPHGDEPWVVYPGNLQARSPKPSERGAKGAVVVEVRDSRVASVEFVACDRVRYTGLDLDVSSLTSVEAVRDLLVDEAQSELDRAGGRCLVLRARLTGRSEAHASLQRPRTIDQLLESVRDDRELRRPWCWWDRIEDASAPLIDVSELRGGSDFAADLIGTFDLLVAQVAASGTGAGLDTDLAADLAEEITATLPKVLRARALSSGFDAADLLAAGLMTALDELGAGETFARTGY